MRSQYWLSMLLLLVIGLASCSTFSYEPIPSERVQIERDRALVYPIYQDSKILLIVSPRYFSSSNGTHIMLKVTVQNNSNKTITVQDRDFTASSSKDRSNWKTLKVIDSKEFLASEKAAFATGTVLMAVGAGLEAASAGRSTSTTTGSVYGSGGYAGYTQTTTTYDPAAAAAVNRQNLQEMAEFQQNGQALIDVLEKSLFFSKKISSAEEYYGLVFLENNADRFLKVELSNRDLELISIEYERMKD